MKPRKLLQELEDYPLSEAQRIKGFLRINLNEKEILLITLNRISEILNLHYDQSRPEYSKNRAMKLTFQAFTWMESQLRRIKFPHHEIKFYRDLAIHQRNTKIKELLFKNKMVSHE